MLQTNSPDNCPSINANSIALFIKWKRSKKGTPLLLPNDTVAMDVLGKEVKSIGGWNNPNNVKQFLSAISVIHRANDQRGQYVQKCEACVALNAANNTVISPGCRFHLYKPRHWTGGNPCS